MMRIIESKAAGAAINYFLSKYYGEDLERSATWKGLAAPALGLSGEVKLGDFASLVKNQHPITKEQITPSQRANRRCGYDVNFHVPKSVSVAWALNQDERIIAAMEEAVSETMENVERHMKSRVRTNKKDEDEKTGNLVYAPFTHLTARPVDDAVPDPHLHVHCYVMNMTYSETEERFKAGQFHDIKKYGPMFEAQFMSLLSEKMRKLGYTPEREGKYWELAEVEKPERDKFSKRSAQIEASITAKGLRGIIAKAAEAVRTRGRKFRGSLDECLKPWANTAGDEVKDRVDMENIKVAPASFEQAIEPFDINEVIDKAVAHCSTNVTTFEYQTLLAKAVQLASHAPVDNVHLAIDDVMRRRRDFIHLEDESEGTHKVTTMALAEREEAVLSWARNGRGKLSPLIQGKEEIQPIDKKNPDLLWASDQVDAITHVWSSPDRVSIIRGIAGAGKTTLMSEAIRGLENHGVGVVALAPTTRSYEGLEGMTDEVHTFQSFMLNTKLQDKMRGRTIFLDEAGMVDTQSALEFFQVAEANNNRIYLVGDSKQLKPVKAGDFLRQLESESGIVTKTVKSIHRQHREDFRDMVRDLSEGTSASVDRAFDYLERATERRDAQQNGDVLDVGEASEIGGFKVMDEDNIYSQVADDFLDGVDAGKTCLAIAPTHRECDKINDAVREGLKQKRTGFFKKPLLGKVNRTFETHVLENWSETDKADIALYEEGQRIGFHAQNGEFLAGDFATVQGLDKNGNVIVKGDNGKLAPLSMKKLSGFDIYERRKMEISKGEKLIINRKTMVEGRKTPMKKGLQVDVVGFTRNGDIKTKTGHVIPKDSLSVSYGYASTIHNSQGRTVDRAFYVHLSRFGDRSMMYVGVSRPRESVTVYTEDLETLRAVVSKSSNEMTALELIEAKKEQDKEQSIVVGSGEVQARLQAELLTMKPTKGMGLAGKSHLTQRGIEREREIEYGE